MSEWSLCVVAQVRLAVLRLLLLRHLNITITLTTITLIIPPGFVEDAAPLGALLPHVLIVDHFFVPGDLLFSQAEDEFRTGGVFSDGHGGGGRARGGLGRAPRFHGSGGGGGCSE